MADQSRRIAKEEQAHKLDVVVALVQAALGATQRGLVSRSAFEQFSRMQAAARWIKEGWTVEAAAGAVDVPADALAQSMNPRANPMMERYQQTLSRYNQDASRVCAVGRRHRYRIHTSFEEVAEHVIG